MRRFVGHQEGGAHLHGARAQLRARRLMSAPVMMPPAAITGMSTAATTAGHNSRGRQRRVFLAADKRAAVAARLDAGSDHGIGADRLPGQRFGDRGDGADHHDAGPMQAFDLLALEDVEGKTGGGGRSSSRVSNCASKSWHHWAGIGSAVPAQACPDRTQQFGGRGNLGLAGRLACAARKN